MKEGRLTRIAVMVLAPAVLLVVGCSQAPEAKLREAEKAVSDAQQAGAKDYLAEQFTKLEGTLNSAKKEIEEQNAKFALFRDYSKAEQMLDSVKAEAPKLIDETAKKKAEAKDAALKALEEAKKAVAETQELVAKAPVGKDRAAVEAIQNDAKALTTSLDEVQAAIDKEDYLGAQAKAKAVQEKSQTLSAEVREAMAKVGGGAAARKK
jgi:hypothetical protein